MSCYLIQLESPPRIFTPHWCPRFGKGSGSWKDSMPALPKPINQHIDRIDFLSPFLVQSTLPFHFEKYMGRFTSVALIRQNQPIWHIHHQRPKCSMTSSQNTLCFCYGGILALESRIQEWTELSPLYSSEIASSSRIPPRGSFAHLLLEPTPSRCSNVFHP